MVFSNTVVDVGALPAAEGATFTPPPPAYFRMLRLQWYITAVVLLLPAIACISFIENLQTPLLISITFLGWLVLCAAYYFLLFKSASVKGYAIREHDVALRHGWPVLQTEWMPFNRVQNCTQEMGPLERRFGLATLKLFTAGSDGADISIGGLPQETAAALRTFILSRINATA